MNGTIALDHFIKDLENLNFSQISNLNFSFILALTDFSRNSNCHFEDLEFIISIAKKNHLSLVLEIDIIPTEDQFQIITEKIKKINSLYPFTYRVKDMGILNFIFSYTKNNIELIAEGMHNSFALQAIENSLDNRLKKIVISKELPKDKIKMIASKINSKIEYQAFGLNLLFYSPRNLLKAGIKNNELSLDYEEKELLLMANSEESPHLGFTVIDNVHGTFMYHPKLLFSLMHIDEFAQFSIQSILVDLRKTQMKISNAILEAIENKNNSFFIDLKNIFFMNSIVGFYHTNKSTVLFSKFKNKFLSKEDQAYIGKVLSVKKTSYLLIQLNIKNIDGDKILIKTPEGRIVKGKLELVKTYYENSQEILGLINYKKGVVPNSYIYLDK